jgi:hypothetical protein
MSVFARSVRQRQPYRGSIVLFSAWARAWRIAIVVAFLWAVTGWAMQWW